MKISVSACFYCYAKNGILKVTAVQADSTDLTLLEI